MNATTLRQHPNAPLTPQGRRRMVDCVVERGWTIEATAARFQVDAKTVRKWRDRFLTEGTAGLMDRSSRPHRSPNRTPLQLRRRVIRLRLKRRWDADHIGFEVGLAASTVQGILNRAGVGRLDRGDRAICVSPSLLSTTAGVGTAYLTGFRDKDGNYLDGDKHYRLRVPAKPPVKRFWAVTAYDPTSRSLLDSGGPITVSSLGRLDVDEDGSVDVFFGAKTPEGKEKNRIKTDPSKGFFVVFRFYGPLDGYINKTWVLNDFELMG